MPAVALEPEDLPGRPLTADRVEPLIPKEIALPVSDVPAVPADPDKPCFHEDFEVWAEVNRLSSVEGAPVDHYSADIKINCANCKEPFRWVGLQAGLRPDRPMVSIDETQLRAPIRPATSDPDFGLGIPGFAVTWSAGE